MIVLAKLMLFPLVFIGVLLLTSFVRWLITGRKPTLVYLYRPTSSGGTWPRELQVTQKVIATYSTPK